MSAQPLVISSRFCGPPNSGNGGYVSGRLAGALSGPVAVRLKAPPPLETQLRIVASESGVQLLHGTEAIAEAKPAQLDLAVPPAPSFADAREASRAYTGFARHPFPRCFVCGPQRGLADGMRIFPGAATASHAMVAAPWVPDASLADAAGSVRPEFLWAALDCTSAFSVLPVPEGKAIVLGELCASLDGSVGVGEKCVVIGWALGIDGRKRFAASSVVSSLGRVVARARATWIEVPASAFAGA